MKTKCLIVGGGFTGLYLSSIIQDSMVVDEAPAFGGLLKDFRPNSGRFVFDIGGHVYTTKDDELRGIMLDSDARFFPERKAFFDFSKRVPYPLQYNAEMLGIQVTTNPMKRYEMLSSLLRHEFGDDLYEKVLKPFNHRVWSTIPEMMSADWTVGRVALMSEKEERWGSNSSFYYAMGKDLISTMEFRSSVKGTVKMRRAKIVSINIDRKEVLLRSESGWEEVIQYETLIDTTGMVLDMTGVHLPFNKVITIGVGLNMKIDDDFHWWYNGINGSPIHRVTLLSRYHEGLAPFGADSLLVEIPVPYGKQMDIFPNDVVDLLRKAKFPHSIGSRDIEEISMLETKGYPIPVLGHRTKIANVRRSMAPHGVFLAGRWGAHGYYNLDHIIKDASETARAIRDGVTDDYLWANYYYKERRT